MIYSHMPENRYQMETLQSVDTAEFPVDIEINNRYE